MKNDNAKLLSMTTRGVAQNYVALRHIQDAHDPVRGQQASVVDHAIIPFEGSIPREILEAMVESMFLAKSGFESATPAKNEVENILDFPTRSAPKLNVTRYTPEGPTN